MSEQEKMKRFLWLFDHLCEGFGLLAETLNEITDLLKRGGE